ncbi:MAG: ATP-binding protein [Nanoarchaeota archaeon]
MDKMIRDALILQKREIESRLREQYIDRPAKIRPDSNLIQVIIGPRRAGKSFFAIHELNKIGPFGYANFDDETLAEIKDYNEIIECIRDVYGNPKTILFDEIQNLPRWELFANRLQRQGFHLVITGSNSNLLSRELATHLTGRHTLLTVLPLSFKEYIRSENRTLTTAEIKNRLQRYLTAGGYPEPLIKKMDYREYLATLFDSILYKDIMKRCKIRTPAAIDALARFLASNVTKEYSNHRLAILTQCKSSHTIEKYLYYLEETFLFFRINRFSFKIREQFSSNKKVYCIDNGFVSAKAFKLSEDLGKMYENCVAIELKKAELAGSHEVYYWRNQQNEEVDFVLKEGTKVSRLIQVCYDLTNPKTRERELRSLLKAGKALKCRNLIVITHEKDAEETAKWFGMTGKIIYIPLWKFLLGLTDITKRSP